MRYLILSDIHSNVTALNAALDAAKKSWQKAICLGDVVGYGPDPNEAIEALQKIGATTIRGNHDKAVSGLTDAEEFNPVALLAALWTRDRLSESNREFLRNLFPGPQTIDGFTVVHGSTWDEDEYIVSPSVALDSVLNSPSPITFFGHTHIQGGFNLRGDDLGVLQLEPTQGRSVSSFQLEPDTKYLLNPGSIGQPRDGDARAAFAILDDDRQVVEFWRVPYDVQDVQDRMARFGLPESLILRLSFGR